MKLAVLNPNFLFGDQSRNFNGYNVEFVRMFQPVLYFPSPFFGRMRRRRAVSEDLMKAGFSPAEFDLAFSASEVNHKADVLIDFNGRPDITTRDIFGPFNGMKVCHVMDYVFNAMKADRELEGGGVDYVMGYADHSKYCSFFQKFYPGYEGKVISVPFGFAPRFKRVCSFSSRINKVIALGAVNPVDDPAVMNRAELLDYINFYKSVRWTHQWRRMLVENEKTLVDVLDSMLPHFPRTKNPDYDAVKMMNKYRMFANDEGLMAFPPARTFEGPAAGAALVCASHSSYLDLGFVDGINCIMHAKHNIGDFKDKVSFYLEHPEILETIAAAGELLVRSRYSHEAVAISLFQSVKERYER